MMYSCIVLKCAEDLKRQGDELETVSNANSIVFSHSLIVVHFLDHIYSFLLLKLLLFNMNQIHLYDEILADMSGGTLATVFHSLRNR